MAIKALESLEQFATDVILDRTAGRRASLLKPLLLFLATIYAGIMRLRARFYQDAVFRRYSVGVMVISVGNLTVGGTGKTPVVEKLARSLHEAGRRVAILSRGYKSAPKPLLTRLADKFLPGRIPSPPRVVSDGKSVLLDSSQAGDEPFMLARNLPGVAVLVDSDRVKSARYAIRNYRSDTLLLDDGFQYLRLGDRFNLLLVDRQNPFGNKHVLPRGVLREPPDALRRADLILLTKCLGTDHAELEKNIRCHNRHAPIHPCSHHPLHLEDVLTGEKQPLSFLRGLRVGALAGIAVPESFFAGLVKLGAEIVYQRSFADHHRFYASEIENALTRTRARRGLALITTEKDSVRFPPFPPRDIPVLFLRVEISMLDPTTTFEQTVRAALGIRPN